MNTVPNKQRRRYLQILYYSLFRLLSWIRTHYQLNTVRRRDPVVSLQQAGQFLLFFYNLCNWKRLYHEKVKHGDLYRLIKIYDVLPIVCIARNYVRTSRVAAKRVWLRMLQYQLIFPHASNYLGSVKVTFLSTGPCFLLLEDLQSVRCQEKNYYLFAILNYHQGVRQPNHHSLSIVL